MVKADIPLEAMLAAGQVLYGKAFNAAITLKALTYYADGDLLEVPTEIRSRIIQAVKNLDAEKVLEFELLFSRKREAKVQNA